MINEEESQETIERRAYVLGMKLKRSGLDQDVIYARLEKNGFAEELAMQVTNDITLERKKEAKKEDEPSYYVALSKIGIGIVLMLLTWTIVPGYTTVPYGLIISGVIFALLYKNKHN